MHALSKTTIMLLALALLLVAAIYGGFLRMVHETWSGTHAAVRLRSFLAGAWEAVFFTAAALLAVFGAYFVAVYSAI